MYPQRGPSSQRHAPEICRNALLVHAVAGLVQSAEEGWREKVFVGPGRDAHVIRLKMDSERMRGFVLSASREIKAEVLDHGNPKIPLLLQIEVSMQRRI